MLKNNQIFMNYHVFKLHDEFIFYDIYYKYIIFLEQRYKDQNIEYYLSLLDNRYLTKEYWDFTKALNYFCNKFDLYVDYIIFDFANLANKNYDKFSWFSKDLKKHSHLLNNNNPMLIGFHNDYFVIFSLENFTLDIKQLQINLAFLYKYNFLNPLDLLLVEFFRNYNLCKIVVEFDFLTYMIEYELRSYNQKMKANYLDLFFEDFYYLYYKNNQFQIIKVNEFDSFKRPIEYLCNIT